MHRQHAEKIKNAISDLPLHKADKARLSRLIRAWDDDYGAAIMNAEESNVIEAEMVAAMAVLFSEPVRACVSPCPGHLGKKSMEALTSTLRVWTNLQELVVRQAQRIRELEASAAVLPMTAFDAGE